MSYILFRVGNGFLLTNGSGGFSSTSLDGLIEALKMPDFFTNIYGPIKIPESFDDGRIPLSVEERETFLRDYQKQF